jgi:hypothetical protein
MKIYAVIVLVSIAKTICLCKEEEAASRVTNKGSALLLIFGFNIQIKSIMAPYNNNFV